MEFDTEQVAAVTGASCTTMGGVAFSPSPPGSGNDVAFVDDVVKAIFPNPGQATIAKMGRLYLEAYTIILADRRARVERHDDGPQRKMPHVERGRRFAVVKERLPGVVISEEIVPESSVVYAFGEMAEL